MSNAKLNGTRALGNRLTILESRIRDGGGKADFARAEKAAIGWLLERSRRLDAIEGTNVTPSFSVFKTAAPGVES